MKLIVFLVSLGAVAGLAYWAQQLVKLNPVLEFPFWAVLLGIGAGIIINLTKLKGLLSAALTEPYIKLGLIFLGASINFSVIMSVGSRGIAQALIGVPLVFFFTWWVAKRLKLDEKFGAILSAAVSICGVSAAIATASSIRAKKEHLAYVTTAIILFALVFMFFQPWLAKQMELSPEVAGAWIGNNIDNTGAVVGAGKLHSETAMKVASIVKMGQNVLIGLAAFLLALYFSFKDRVNTTKPRLRELWDKFPKFVLGFILMSVLVSVGWISGGTVKEWLNPIRVWLFAMAFVSIGMTVPLSGMLKIGGRPLVVLLLATAFNLVSAYVLANIFFGGFTL